MVLSKAPPILSMEGLINMQLTLVFFHYMFCNLNIIDSAAQRVYHKHVANQGVYCCMLTIPYMECLGAN